MSGSSLGFSSWGRRRSPSVTSRPAARDIPGARSVSQSRADPRQLSTSVSSNVQQEPTRSFIPGSTRELAISPSAVDSSRFALSVREDTASLASYVLSDKKDNANASLLTRRGSGSSYGGRETSFPRHDLATDDAGTETIEEVSEPVSPEEREVEARDDGPSVLSSLLQRTGQEDSESFRQLLDDEESDVDHQANLATNRGNSRLSPGGHGHSQRASETTPLLRTVSSHSQPVDSPEYTDTEDVEDVENQKPRPIPWHSARFTSLTEGAQHSMKVVAKNFNPKTWDGKLIWQHAVLKPLSCLPAVVLGLLLNILDALSYGMILFPLGNPIFASLGPAGISIFYVSTIISQLTYSSASIFRGATGSELIEVVPFFHSMAATITNIVGEDQPEAVIATTILAFAISSILTGVIFYLMGRFKLGYIVGFIPRHILLGCIGGVGWFLVATGFEVSARLDGFHYDLDTMQRLIQPDTLPLWIIPLVLGVLLWGLQKKISSKYFLSVYIICIPVIFYFFVLSFDSLQMQPLRDSGWIFAAPPAGQPWWYFWTLYNFRLVRWDALVETVGAMFALTFFSLLHVPINVPALAQSIGEDNADLNHELKLHGYSNLISGLVGSIQNYLVYANSLFFMRSGGDSRLAGFLLAGFTAIVMFTGGSMIGYIPVMMVGTLIFSLGFELLEDALARPRRKLDLLEYLTIVVIVLVMGIYDFVAGIFLGLILAFISVVIYQSRVSIIRATYTGVQVGSIVRRNPSQYNYLRRVGRQTYIIKLNGNLFFGTIVGLQEKIRALISDDAFAENPIKFLIVDLWQVTGIDYSAAEGFMTLNRLLNKKGVTMLISGKDVNSSVGNNLRAVGLGEGGAGVMFLPDLNSALESCENEQLKIFYSQQEALRVSRPTPSSNLEVPGSKKLTQTFDVLSQSPRRSHLQEVANSVLIEQETQRARWRTIGEPLRLMLQIFHEVSDRNEDFWYKAKPYFTKREYPAGTVLYHHGEPANGFYLLESGELCADYDTPQGKLSEPIVQGTTCGELPFFSQTDRTATVVAVRDCVAWVMDTTSSERLREEENEIYQELLRVSLKLTTERMKAMTNYIMAQAN